MISLNDITLVAVATTRVEETVEALLYSQKEISFEKVKLFANYNPEVKSEKYEYVEIEPFSDVGEWGRFVVYDLYKYIDTKYIILIHADGFIVNPSSWDDEFLKYDYIGAPWPVPRDEISYRDYLGNIIRSGNSVSLRSYELLKYPAENNIEWDHTEGYFHEDGFICVKIRHLLEREGMKFPPLEVACKFAHEKKIPEIKNIKPFAFHKWEGTNSIYPRFGKYKISLIKKIINKLREILWRK